MDKLIKEEIKRFLEISKYNLKEGKQEEKKIILEATIPSPTLDKLAKAFDKAISKMSKAKVGTAEEALYKRWKQEAEDIAIRTGAKLEYKASSLAKVFLNNPSERAALAQFIGSLSKTNTTVSNEIANMCYTDFVRMFIYFKKEGNAVGLPMARLKAIIDADLGTNTFNKFFDKFTKEFGTGYEKLGAKQFDSMLKAKLSSGLSQVWLGNYPRYLIKSWYARLFKSWKSLTKESDEKILEIQQKIDAGVPIEQLEFEVETVLTKLYALNGKGWVRKLVTGADNPYRTLGPDEIINSFIMKDEAISQEVKDAITTLMKNNQRFQTTTYNLESSVQDTYLVPLAERASLSAQSRFGTWVFGKYIDAWVKKSRNIADNTPAREGFKQMINGFFGDLLPKSGGRFFRRLAIGTPRTFVEIEQHLNSASALQIATGKLFSFILWDVAVYPVIYAALEKTVDKLRNDKEKLTNYYKKRGELLSACLSRSNWIKKYQSKFKIAETEEMKNNKKICDELEKEQKEAEKELGKPPLGWYDYYIQNLPIVFGGNRESDNDGAYDIDFISKTNQTYIKNTFAFSKLDEIGFLIANGFEELWKKSADEIIKDYEQKMTAIKNIDNQVQQFFRQSPCYNESLSPEALYEAMLNCDATSETAWLTYCNRVKIEPCSKKEGKLYGTDPISKELVEYVFDNETYTYVTKSSYDLEKLKKPGGNVNSEDGFRKFCEIYGYKNPYWDKSSLQIHTATVNGETKEFYFDKKDNTFKREGVN